MRKYFTLRTQLIPYLYTYSWRAHQDAVPILRPLYLEYPELEEAYRHSHEYFFGGEMLVAPVLDPSGQASIYLPPGRWLDFFTGKRYEGGSTFSARYAAEDMPVFVREGAIIPEQRASGYSNAEPLEVLILNVYGAGKGGFDLYEDDGVSLAYAEGQHAHTALRYDSPGDGTHRLLIEPTQGAFRGQPQSRAYELRIHAAERPTAVSINGAEAGQWSWDAGHSTATITLPGHPIRERISVVWR
jgi:alpha-glucosidase (family GH31 glycosyl hydrolase)